MSIDSADTCSDWPYWLLVRGLPALLFVRFFDRREVLAAGLLQATSLPFIVTATQIGVLTGLMDGVTAAALVCAGLLSVIVFPAAPWRCSGRRSTIATHYRRHR